jgi:cytochrome c biogenesis protein CcmG, thiol:disulfide interchange protein DsbE
VPILGVNVQDAPANAEAFVDELGITYDLAADPKGELYAAVEAFGMPTTLLVDADGMIVYRHTGLLDARALREHAAEHLGVEIGSGDR